MGHQAANCKTGTIKFREVFGDDAFIMRRSVFSTDMAATRAARQVEYDVLSADALEYARAQAEDSGLSYAEIEEVAAKSQSIDCEALLKEMAERAAEQQELRHKQRRENPAAAAAAAAVVAAPAIAAPVPSSTAMPPGWAVAHVRCSQSCSAACDKQDQLRPASYAGCQGQAILLAHDDDEGAVGRAERGDAHHLSGRAWACAASVLVCCCEESRTEESRTELR